MTLPSNRYRDPLKVVIDDESRTCKGCKNWVKYVVCGEPKMICEKGKKNAGHQMKCYEEMPGKIYCNGGR